MGEVTNIIDHWKYSRFIMNANGIQNDDTHFTYGVHLSYKYKTVQIMIKFRKFVLYNECIISDLQPVDRLSIKCVCVTMCESNASRKFNIKFNFYFVGSFFNV